MVRGFLFREAYANYHGNDSSSHNGGASLVIVIDEGSRAYDKNASLFLKLMASWHNSLPVSVSEQAL